MTNEQGIAKLVRMHDLGRELQRLALTLSEDGEPTLSRNALRLALLCLSYKLPKGAVEDGQS